MPQPQDKDRHFLTALDKRAFADVNEILPHALVPWGAYAMGAVTVVAFKAGRIPPRAILEAAAKIGTHDEMDAFVKKIEEQAAFLKKPRP